MKGTAEKGAHSMEPTETMVAPANGFSKTDIDEILAFAKRNRYTGFNLNNGNHDKDYPIQDLVYAYGIHGTFKLTKKHKSK